MSFNILPFNNASGWLGLRIGRQSLSQVRTLLADEGAEYEDGLGYKGHSETLPSIQIQHFSNFDQYGEVRDGWLEFASNHKLYNIFVEWTDHEGETFHQLKKICDRKYGKSSTRNVGLITVFKYRAGDTEITLHRDLIGVDEQHVVSLTLSHLPLKNSVRSAKRKILEKVKRDIEWDSAINYA